MLCCSEGGLAFFPSVRDSLDSSSSRAKPLASGESDSPSRSLWTTFFSSVFVVAVPALLVALLETALIGLACWLLACLRLLAILGGFCEELLDVAESAVAWLHGVVCSDGLLVVSVELAQLELNDLFLESPRVTIISGVRSIGND